MSKHELGGVAYRWGLGNLLVIKTNEGKFGFLGLKSYKVYPDLYDSVEEMDTRFPDDDCTKFAGYIVEKMI